MKQKAIAKKIGVSESGISMILNGKIEMGKATAKKFALKMDVPWNEIIAMDRHQLRELLEEVFSDA